jgi:hypothetical protein
VCSPAGTWADLPYTNYVWFEATGLNPQSSVLSQGAQEADLRLECDTSGGPTLCEWNLAMRMHSTQQFGSMGTNLLGNTDKHAIVNLLHGGEFPSNSHLFTEVNTGGTLVQLKEVNIPILPGPIYDPTDGAAGDYLLATMTLRTIKAAGDMTTDGINATINELLWESLVEPSLPDEPTYVMFGDGPVLDGHVQGGLAECITIQNIPEPATLSLLIPVLSLSMKRRVPKA